MRFFSLPASGATIFTIELDHPTIFKDVVKLHQMNSKDLVIDVSLEDKIKFIVRYSDDFQTTDRNFRNSLGVLSNYYLTCSELEKIVKNFNKTLEKLHIESNFKPRKMDGDHSAPSHGNNLAM